MSRELVVLSPHFDDAALAVGALVAARAAAGRRVRILTVYTAGPDTAGLTGRRRAFGDYAVRRAEDDRALARLGAGGMRLGLRERLFRDPPLPRPVHIFRTPEDVRGLTECDRIQREITRLLDESPRAQILAPLGIGNHHDHVEVAVAAMRAAATHPDRVLFYEDFNALSELCRRHHPVSRTAPFPWQSAPAWASPRAGTGLEAMSFIPRGPSAPELAGLSPGRGGGSWCVQTLPVHTHEAVQLRAVAEYRSQLPLLGGPAAVAKFIRRAHRTRGGELLWHLSPARPARRVGRDEGFRRAQGGHEVITCE
ncbi:PIG-L family deacetylase [Nocardia inohanensis]|uniref:PIG-L family deacetylase n=1 Tax=Nocardia inohanensis TaxID=209246 RepID=UPI0008324CCD|nr:PIG-L family deacetylase [Nocardia inohanensis]